MNAQDKWGYTALHYAAYNSHVGVTRVLLLNNADGSIKTAKKKMALDFALINNDTLATSGEQKFCNAKTKVADLLLKDKERRKGNSAEAESEDL